jgi:hypothetical protein
MVFAAFPYDYNILWHTPEDRDTYLTILEDHLKFMHSSPALISRVLNIVIGTGLLGFIVKLYKPDEANVLFDGASLALYLIAIAVYVTNIVKTMRVITAGGYTTYESAPESAADALDRNDSLSVLAASNTILALILIGILVLQAGQWYAQSKEEAEEAEMDRVADQKKKTTKKNK